MLKKGPFLRLFFMARGFCANPAPPPTSATFSSPLLPLGPFYSLAQVWGLAPGDSRTAGEVSLRERSLCFPAWTLDPPTPIPSRTPLQTKSHMSTQMTQGAMGMGGIKRNSPSFSKHFWLTFLKRAMSI